MQIPYHPGKVNVVADALTRKVRHTLNTVVITQLNLLRELEKLDVQLVSHGQAYKNINGFNSFKLEPIVVHNLGSTFVFEESIELPAVDVIKIQAENFP